MHGLLAVGLALLRAVDAAEKDTLRVLGAQSLYGAAVEAATRTRAQPNGTTTTNPMMANR